MLDVSRIPLFLIAALILLLTPGPAVLYIIARSVDQGRLAGLVSVLSIEAGNFLHVIAATLGLSALVFSSAMGFALLKYIGAAYLVYLGIRRFMTSLEKENAIHLKEQRLGRIFSQGVLVAALNPKTALFFLAFLPQFVDPLRGAIPVQFFALGSIFVSMAIVTDGLYSLLASSASRWIKSNAAFGKLEKIAAGIVYIGLGITAAFSGSGQK